MSPFTGAANIMSMRSLEEALQGRNVEAVTVKIATTWDELEGAFRLVHQNYLRCGLTQPNVFDMRVTPYHLRSTTEVFVGILRSEVVCCMTLVRDEGLGLPLEDIYSPEISALKARGVKLAEVSCLADRRGDFARSLPLVLRLMSLMAQCAKLRGVDMLVIAVHPRHAKFYERFTCFRCIGEERAYHTVRDKPAVALALDLRRAPIDHPEEYRRFFGTPFSDAELAYRPIPASLRERMRPIVEASYFAASSRTCAECLPLPTDVPGPTSAVGST